MLISLHDSLVLITLMSTPDNSLGGSCALYVQLSVNARTNNDDEFHHEFNQCHGQCILAPSFTYTCISESLSL